jgi:hypothetical protein
VVWPEELLWPPLLLLFILLLLFRWPPLPLLPPLGGRDGVKNGGLAAGGAALV